MRSATDSSSSSRRTATAHPGSSRAEGSDRPASSAFVEWGRESLLAIADDWDREQYLDRSSRPRSTSCLGGSLRDPSAADVPGWVAVHGLEDDNRGVARMGCHPALRDD